MPAPMGSRDSRDTRPCASTVFHEVSTLRPCGSDGFVHLVWCENRQQPGGWRRCCSSALPSACAALHWVLNCFLCPRASDANKDSQCEVQSPCHLPTANTPVFVTTTVQNDSSALLLAVICAINGSATIAVMTDTCYPFLSGS